jgi:glycerophosphoryl diester phosphodiesterase
MNSQVPMRKHSYLSSVSSFKIFAHRGLCYKNGNLVFDENCIPAFLQALESGADYLELDVQSSKDDSAIVFHDATLDRISHSSGLVSELDLAELRNIKLRHGGKISTFDEVLRALPKNCKINVDVKTNSAIADLASTILKHSAQERILVTSFSEKRRKAALSAIPGVATSPSGSLVFRIWLSIKLGLDAKKLLKLVNVLQIPVSYGPIRFDSPRFIESVKRHGVELVYWTINDPAEARRLRLIGANGIVTDRSDLMTSLFANE